MKNKLYIIAELNTSHFGDIENAKKMIEEVKNTGADCVKFQSWNTDSLYSEQYYKENKIAKRFISKFSLSEDELIYLSKYANELGIDFASTPYSIEEAKFLVEKCNVPFIKIASMELNNLDYLRQLAKLDTKLILSTGMGEFEEIKRAVECIEESLSQELIILHCVSLYPCPLDKVNLNNINLLRNSFKNNEIGLSDHTEGYEVAIASIGMGVKVIEKHFTLDKKRIGMDNQMATEPETFKIMIDMARNVYRAMGSYERLLSKNEMNQRLTMRRSIVAKHDLAIGDKIEKNNITFKRPGDGVPPSKTQELYGKVLKKEILKGHKIMLEDLRD